MSLNIKENSVRGDATSWWSNIGLVLFYAIAVSVFGYLAWMVPYNYRVIEPSRIVPDDITSEKVLSYLSGLSKQDRDALIVLQEAQFAKEPLDRSALLNLSVLYNLAGDAEKGNAVALRAADRSFRDLGAQTVAINLSIAQKDYADAMRRIDGLLRSRPEYSKNYYPLIMNISSTKEGLAAALQLISTLPPWRKKFLDFATQQPDLKSVTYSLYTGLRGAESAISNDEMKLFIDRLFERKDYDTAYFIWLDFLSPAELSKVGMIFDGGFELVVHNLSYGWNLIPINNSEAKIVPKVNFDTDLALNLRFSSLKESLPKVFQDMRLDSGEYVLSGEAKSEQFETPSGLVWRVMCFESGAQIGASPAFSAEAPWKSFEFDIVVPTDNCATQKLYLDWATAATLDRVVNGSISFDNIKITRLEN